jgi:peptide/nickel transport system substrate-binding protein
LVLAFVAASCGSDDSSSDDTSAPDATEATDEGETETTTAEAEGDVDTSIVEQTAEAAYGGTVIMGLEAEATGLRGWEDGCATGCYNIMRTIYDTFTESLAEGGYGPYLAESLEPNEDFTVWTMTLRPDVTFHNGTPLTAQLVADMFPIQQTGAQSSGAIASSLRSTTSRSSTR